MALQIGDKIPEILGTNQDGVQVTASDYVGSKLIIYFYPKDNTPGCTAQACNLRDNFTLLQERGYKILGVSIDTETSHQKFIEKQQLPFSLIADTDKRMVETFGVWGEKTLAGRKYMGTLRTTFLVDEFGIIEAIIDAKSVKTKDHAQQILNLK